MGSVIDGPPTIKRPSRTQGRFFRVFSSETNLALCSSETVGRNLKRTIKCEFSRVASAAGCSRGEWFWIAHTDMNNRHFGVAGVKRPSLSCAGK
jgi:hypothetical protein